MPISYSDATPVLDDYVALFRTTGWTFRRPVTPDVLALSLEKSWLCVFAYDGDKLVGAGRVVTDGWLHAIVYDVMVAPDYQRQGIGKKIMQRLLHACLDAEIGTIQLFCARGKQAFYEKLGFVVRPDDGPGMQYRPAPASAPAN
jgi:GNAT superfamily N-acetyltransferase